MKILCFTDCLGAGGAQRQLVGLASMLHQRGMDVKVCYYFDRPFYKDDLDEAGVPHELILSADNHIKRIPAVTKFFSKEKPDWVIAYQGTPSLVATFAKIMGGHFHLIVSERTTTQHTGFNERLRFNSFRWADYIVPNAYTQEKYIKSTFPFLSKKVVTIPNFVDLDHFVPSTTHIKNDIPEIIVAASIRQLKNTIGLIDAAAAMKDKGYKFHISWYGKTEQHKDYCVLCQKKINQLGVGDYIELKEKTKQIKECYQHADYFCLPSFYEGTPNVICEAMACGLPVVCSDVCDNSRYVIEGENGFLFNPKDTNSIVAAFERLFTLGDKEYMKYCHNSRTLAEQKLSKEVFVSTYLKLIKE